MRPVALTIAGSDPSGGAGIQADLKTFHQHQVYGAAVVSVLTVQNTLGVTDVSVVPAKFVAAQLDAVASDLSVVALKTGALGSESVVTAVADVCMRFGLRPVVDPVRISKAGAPLLTDGAREALCSKLLPQALLVTPNLDEAAWLLGANVEALQSDSQIREAARALAEFGSGAVLVKGGHRRGDPHDLLWNGERFVALQGRRVQTRHTHGVGCTLSAAICSQLALGRDLVAACIAAKSWLQHAIEQAPEIGQGQGPVEHLTMLS